MKFRYVTADIRVRTIIIIKLKFKHFFNRFLTANHDRRTNLFVCQHVQGNETTYLASERHSKIF